MHHYSWPIYPPPFAALTVNSEKKAVKPMVMLSMNGKNADSGPASYEPQMPWHTIEADRIMEIFGVSQAGLKPDEARKRLDRFGPNSLPGKGTPSLGEVFIRQFKSPLIYILLAAGTVSVVIDEYLGKNCNSI
jgi:magnesium-transporting ATPase (P-type)